MHFGSNFSYLCSAVEFRNGCDGRKNNRVKTEELLGEQFEQGVQNGVFIRTRIMEMKCERQRLNLGCRDYSVSTLKLSFLSMLQLGEGIRTNILCSK